MLGKIKFSSDRLTNVCFFTLTLSCFFARLEMFENHFAPQVIRQLETCASDWARLAQSSFDADSRSLALLSVQQQTLSSLATWIEMVVLKSSLQGNIYTHTELEFVPDMTLTGDSQVRVTVHVYTQSRTNRFLLRSPSSWPGSSPTSREWPPGSGPWMRTPAPLPSRYHTCTLHVCRR